MKSLIKKLTRKKLKISFVESCTGGMLSNMITSISGASKVFNLGLITYSNQAKIKVLKVNKNIIKKHGAVSPECCKSMVINLAKLSKANINVSITGIKLSSIDKNGATTLSASNGNLLAGSSYNWVLEYMGTS